MSVENDDGEDIALTIQKFANGSNSEILIYCINFLSEMAIFYPQGSGVVVVGSGVVVVGSGVVVVVVGSGVVVVVVAQGIVCISPEGHSL